MNRRHYRIKTVDELAISLSILLELLRLISEQLKYVIGRIAGFELVGERVLGRIDPNLLGIVGQSSIENVLKRRRRHFCTVC